MSNFNVLHCILLTYVVLTYYGYLPPPLSKQTPVPIKNSTSYSGKGNLAPAEGRTRLRQQLGGVSRSKYLVEVLACVKMVQWRVCRCLLGTGSVLITIQKTVKAK